MPPYADVMASRQRNLVERELTGCPFGKPFSAVCIGETQARYGGERAAALERLDDPRQHPLSIIHDNRRNLRREEGTRIRRRGVTANDNRYVWRQRAHTPSQRQHFVGFEGVHRRDAHEPGTRNAQMFFERAEAQIGNGHLMPMRFERRRDVLHPERFDSEEGTEAKALVRRHRTQQKDSHLFSVRG